MRGARRKIMEKCIFSDNYSWTWPYGRFQGYLIKESHFWGGQLITFVIPYPPENIIFELSGFRFFCYRIDKSDKLGLRNSKNMIFCGVLVNHWLFPAKMLKSLTKYFLIFSAISAEQRNSLRHCSYFSIAEIGNPTLVHPPAQNTEKCFRQNSAFSMASFHIWHGPPPR